MIAAKVQEESRKAVEEASSKWCRRRVHVGRSEDMCPRAGVVACM
jgi:hypothetical protein